MPLPTKSRYSIAEAAKHIGAAAGETVTQAQVLDWAAQGLYHLHLAIEHGNIRANGTTAVVNLRDSTAEVRPNSEQAAKLARGERIGLTACWHNSVACTFVRQRTGDYSGWAPDTVYFGAAALVLFGKELHEFTATIAHPSQQAPASAPAPSATPDATGAPGDATQPAAVPVEVAIWWQTKHDVFEMAQNIGSRLQSQGKRASNSAIAKEIESAMNGIERSKASGRTAPNWDTIRGHLKNWKWKPE